MQRTSTLLLASAAVFAAGCSSDDDVVIVTPPNTSTSFSTSLTRGATANNATLGSAVLVTVNNNAPAMGTFQTPAWVGIHDGTFDIYDLGSPASAALESLAEDGDASALDASFTGQSSATFGGVVFNAAGGPISPGESTSAMLRVNAATGAPIYLSYASMVIPSNDAFVANGGPTTHEMFDAAGTFTGTGFTVLGTEVLDAGTETNDEVPANTAFFGQMTPNTGTDEGANIANHVGFMAAAPGNILGDAMFVNADFENAVGYETIEVSVSDVSGSIAEPTGSAFVTVNEVTMMATVNLSVSNLSGPATLLHLHEGAVGQAGPVLVDLMTLINVNEGGTTTANGTVAVTESDIQAMRDGNVYFNLHTALNPAGEVRGQVLANNAAVAALDGASNVTPPIAGSNIRVTVQNTAPEFGTFQTPVWVGFHDGNFDIYDSGVAASAELERIAEDGNAGPLGDSLATSGFGSVRGVVAGSSGPIAPGETASALFRVNPTAATNRYLSWATMILPSNDAFLANGAETAHEIFDGAGTFNGINFGQVGGDALDAGTEVNDELAANTAFFGQMNPDTGVDEMGTIGAHPGFNALMSGGILDDAMFVNADFTALGYEFLSVSFAEVAASGPAATGNTTLRMGLTTTTIDVAAANLTGAARSVTLNEGAVGVDNGTVLIDLSDDIDVNANGVLQLNGTFTRTAAFNDAMAAGEVYLQVTTDLNPTGELRGQVTEAP